MKCRRTDWDAYHSGLRKTALLTRKHTASVLTRIMLSNGGAGASILEFGGGNSCFIDGILKYVGPSRYDVIDDNRVGLDLLKSRYPSDDRVSARHGDVLSVTDRPEHPYDIVFSVGLIEHFDRAGTARAITSHLRYLRSNGLAIITFPTPTWLYRSVRWVAEATGNWIFYDERPLELEECVRAIGDVGEIKSARILWPLVLTQYCVEIRKVA